MTDTIRPIEEGQHYEHTRGSIYNVKYLNDDIVLLYDGDNYRLEQLDYFKSCVESNMFEFLSEFEPTESEVKINFENIDWVGDEAIDSLENAGLTTPSDFDYMTDEKILDLNAVGEKGLENIKQWINENQTDTVEI